MDGSILEPAVEKQPTFDTAWKRRAVRGEADAIDQFVTASMEPLFRFCFYRVGQNRHLCEEVVQETITRAISQLPNYDPSRSRDQTFPWLTGLARNEIRRVLQQAAATTSLEAIWARMDDQLRAIFNRLESEPLTEDVLERAETREMVNATMSQLPPHYREALEAKYVERHSVREIAAQRATSDKAIESLLTRARQAFRKTFLALAQSLNTEVFPS